MSPLKKLRKMLAKQFEVPVHIVPDPICNIVRLSLYIPPNPAAKPGMPIEWFDDRLIKDWVRIELEKKRAKGAAWKASIMFRGTEESKQFSLKDPLEEIVEWLNIRYCVFKFEV